MERGDEMDFGQVLLIILGVTVAFTIFIVFMALLGTLNSTLRSLGAFLEAAAQYLRRH